MIEILNTQYPLNYNSETTYWASLLTTLHLKPPCSASCSPPSATREATHKDTNHLRTEWYMTQVTRGGRRRVTTGTTINSLLTQSCQRARRELVVLPCNQNNQFQGFAIFWWEMWDVRWTGLVRRSLPHNMTPDKEIDVAMNSQHQWTANTEIFLKFFPRICFIFIFFLVYHFPSLCNFNTTNCL